VAAELPFPFIVSSGRAGSTLLRAMLDCHPEVAITPQTYFVTQLLTRRERYERDDGLDAGAFLGDVLPNKWFRRWDLDDDEVRAEISRTEPRDYAGAIRCLYRAFARSRGKSRYGDKTPNYIHEIPTLAGVFPEARFVHIIRDGRDVASAFIDQEKMRPNGIAEAALLWRERVSAGRSGGREVGPGRYSEVRYEHLVATPEPALRELCEFLELEYDPAMLAYTERAAEVVAIDGGAERHGAIFQPPTPGMRDWRRELEPAEVEAFELIAGDLLTELGYERASRTPTVTADSPPGVLVAEVDRLRREVEETERRLRRRSRRTAERLTAERERHRETRRRLEQATNGADAPLAARASAAVRGLFRGSGR
jgi:Sulfotransferase family